MTRPSSNSFVVLAFGPQPIESLGKASKLCGPNAVMDSDLARVAGAVFAVGSVSALKTLSARLSAGAERVSHVGAGLSAAALEWLANGERDNSSNTIFTVLLNVVAIDREIMSHPLDFGDWRRCQLLIESVPEIQSRFHTMGSQSIQWNRLVRDWPLILSEANAERPDWRTGGMYPEIAREIIEMCVRS
ncbi:hypothetical protein [Hydrogenophaga sp. NFH-34]|uniref:hypothetical protein n=1 Tax=Hydrogenophaga sp. NFH-34 TaxID=2744446 RepID=UPI001F315935|nr:hypothetical protein [Hydrogenophaga sp. NFH-34]